MKRKDLLRAVVGTSKPIHVTKREYVIFDRCLKIINNLENEVKELNLDFVSNSVICPCCNGTGLCENFSNDAAPCLTCNGSGKL